MRKSRLSRTSDFRLFGYADDTFQIPGCPPPSALHQFIFVHTPATTTAAVFGPRSHRPGSAAGIELPECQSAIRKHGPPVINFPFLRCDTRTCFGVERSITHVTKNCYSVSWNKKKDNNEGKNVPADEAGRKPDRTGRRPTRIT